MQHWQTSRFLIDLSQPKIMGIVNVTPDSFSDGGTAFDPQRAIEHAASLLKQGAHVLDVGAESSRPGAQPVPLAQELDRLRPVVQELVRWNVPISIDTYKPLVMQTMLDMGVDIINDIWALRQVDAASGLSSEQAVAAHASCGVCLMHMHQNPQTMQLAPMTEPVVPAVMRFLQDRVQSLLDCGIDQRRLVLDAGIGFGKTPHQNWQLLAAQPLLQTLNVPWLAGWSRKSTLGLAVADAPLLAQGACIADTRLVPSVVAALLAVQGGAKVVRVHDVRATLDALTIWQTVQQAQLTSAAH